MTEKKDPMVEAMEEQARQNQQRLKENLEATERPHTKTPILAAMQAEMMMTVVDSVLPSLKPFIEPGINKLNEFLGDDEKLLVVRRLNGVSILFVIDKSKGAFEITNETMNIDEDACIVSSPLNVGIESLLKGKLFDI